MAHRRTALISVYNKKGIEDFAKALVSLNFDIMASGGTAKSLKDAGVEVIDVASIVGDPILGHRVVTLSRELHAGLLSTQSTADVQELEKLGIRRIDLVCCDMYPLVDEIAKADATIESVIGQTDIGGPTMLRSGGKGRRIVICDVEDRMPTISWLRSGMPNEETYLRKLHAKAEAVIADYVLASARFHGAGNYEGVIGVRVGSFRYGENPHQKKAAHFARLGASKDSLAIDRFTMMGGAGPSFINGTDLDQLVATAVRVAAGLEKNGFSKHVALAMKHGNVCGIGVADEPQQALEKMIMSDPLALFGGAVLCTFPLDQSLAEMLRTLGGSRVLDLVVAPSFHGSAMDTLNRKNDKCRMYENPALGNLGCHSMDLSQRIRPCRGGFFTQDADAFVLSLPMEWREALSSQQQIDMLVGWGIGSTATSNSIVLVADGMLLGRGLAQPSRVLAVKVALLHAQENGHAGIVPRAVAYSDSFFPHQDGVEALGGADIKVVFATSGSMADKKVLDVAHAYGIGLYQLPDVEARGFSRH